MEQTGGQRGGMSGSEDFGTAYRGHYQTNFANSGYQYEHYEPAYLYGRQLSGYEGYQGWEWDRVEPEAQRAWEERNPGSWERMRDAVRYGWTTRGQPSTGQGSMSEGSTNRQSRR